ncbi:uncharacterized protein LOC124290511 [Haliotis rubra]|uniref:uncharacterized protein LOC124290511 n=1 Tax=Haliotis rubra TaxID=36100 RepID=UPI001EE6328B|nr:uncharacterized protein LOC124290511 [Haliotis rubra]XP_046583205.1 uncharacterized protein LOC124290511 [Haliotis rubra]XP_046583206.1 uncharacterized protein LOC124290511 [Haliotis rubra]XP_046583207.1 uncharacterized protein LOC124290511 [Haliotis rubra]XP_046583208.1 uncharacterized protein LOC124290511 [Haliotis rubra]XP_046583210.1 uncharacterized protein LOC124290511 [Haliotis rubra]
MGKDTKVIWTKDGLKSENMKLGHKIRELETQYREIRAIFVQLEQDYDNSYSAFPIQRYAVLKRMIKRCVKDENLRKADTYAKTDTSKPKSGLSGLLGKAKDFADKDRSASGADNSASGSSGRSGSDAHAGGMGGLLSACKTFAGKSDGIETAAATRKDLSKMSKQEVLEDNELKRKQIEAFGPRFMRAFNRLEQLKTDYETSKQSFPLSRYGIMKNMIKDVTRDKSLH